MNWEALGAVGEVLGAVGVISSLLYLAVQIRRDRGGTYCEYDPDASERTPRDDANDPDLGSLDADACEDRLG